MKVGEMIVICIWFLALTIGFVWEFNIVNDKLDALATTKVDTVYARHEAPLCARDTIHAYYTPDGYLDSLFLNKELLFTRKEKVDTAKVDTVRVIEWANFDFLDLAKDSVHMYFGENGYLDSLFLNGEILYRK